MRSNDPRSTLDRLSIDPRSALDTASQRTNLKNSTFSALPSCSCAHEMEGCKSSKGSKSFKSVF